jgi:hypothetical protein
MASHLVWSRLLFEHLPQTLPGAVGRLSHLAHLLKQVLSARLGDDGEVADRFDNGRVLALGQSSDNRAKRPGFPETKEKSPAFAGRGEVDEGQ